MTLHAIHTACGIETLKGTCFHKELELHAIHTACGIETSPLTQLMIMIIYCMQSIPLAVLKRALHVAQCVNYVYCMQSIPLAVLKLRTIKIHNHLKYCMQSIPLAVLKPALPSSTAASKPNCMQSIPLAVLKLFKFSRHLFDVSIACNPYRLRY